MPEEIQAPYELVRVDIGEGGQETPEYRAINPMLKVPALEDGEAVVAESGAILLYLADRFRQARLAPRLEDPKRGRFLQWMFFAAGCMEPAFGEKYAGWTPHSTPVTGAAGKNRSTVSISRGLVRLAGSSPGSAAGRVRFEGGKCHGNPALPVPRRPLRRGARVLPQGTRRRGRDAHALQGVP